MILDLDLSNNSFTKFLALVHDANELLEEIDNEHRERDTHRISFQVYRTIRDNDKNEFNRRLSDYLSRLNSLAMRYPYSNQATLLLIDALHTVTSDIYFYDNLNDLYSDIKFIQITEFRWDDYREQPTQTYEEPTIGEHEPSIVTKDFDFDDDVLSNASNAKDESNIDDDFSNFDFDNDTKSAGESVIRKQNTINEKEVERRFLAQSEKGSTNTIPERDIEGLPDDEFDFGSTSEAADEKNFANLNGKPQFKPWVKPFFTLSGVALAGLLVYGYFF